MKKLYFVLVVLALVANLFNFTPALADGSNGCEHGQGNKPCEEEIGVTEDGGDGQQGGGQLPIGGNAGSVDPCVAAGNCGNGDHGKGNPTNGSLHANCRAAQGEVDPICKPNDGTPPATETPVVPPTETPPGVLVPPVSVTPEPGDDDGETPVVVVDGKEIPIRFTPYEAPDGMEITGKPVVADCPQDCCCECQSNLDWLKPWIIALVVIMAVIALVQVARFVRQYPVWAAFLFGLVLLALRLRG